MKKQLSNWKTALIYFLLSGAIVPILLSAVSSNIILRIIIFLKKSYFEELWLKNQLDYIRLTMNILSIFQFVTLILFTWISIMIVSKFIRSKFILENPVKISVISTFYLIILQIVLSLYRYPITKQILIIGWIPLLIVSVSVILFFLSYYFLSKLYLSKA